MKLRLTDKIDKVFRSRAEDLAQVIEAYLAGMRP
jgi:hypothetical protein